MNKYQKELEALLKKQYASASDELKKAYGKSLKEIKNKVEYYMMQHSSLSYAQKLEVARLTSLMVQIENELDFLSDVQQQHVYKYLQSSGHVAYNELFYDFEQTHGFSIEFNLLNRDLIQTIIDTPIKGIKLSARLNDGVISTLKANLLSQLQIGLAQGKSYAEMAQALSDVADSSYKRAMTIMRTEAGRVQAVTRQKSQTEADNQGVEFEKVWSSTLSLATRDTHRALDGQAVKPNEKFKSPSGHAALQPHMFGVAKEDINCRCRTYSRVKGVKPELRRDNETKKVVKYRNYKEWEKGRSVA
ncbi:phage minor head protein [Enterococcus sp. 5H]|uniref:phage minor head protein n=1 Tax=Enterococcus sp. 5H TaxID=1229490 RepID=UPI002302DCAE|nr:phage minor head protein [Enterococcus sp. 5H]MDA9472651.1 minor head protein [Enterococcus sp. 5H]